MLPRTIAAAPLTHPRARVSLRGRLLRPSLSSFSRTPYPLALVAPLTTTHPATMSLANEKHEWGAVRVRQTFLDYFKERGHTFGRSWYPNAPVHAH